MSAVREIAIGVPQGRQSHSTALYVLAALFLVGAASFVYMLTMRPDGIPWSFVTASYIFLLGVSQFGTAFVAIMRICRTRWARPFYRTAELATLAFFPFAIVMFLLIFAYGKEQLFYWLSPAPGEHLSPWLNADFLFWRNLGAQLVFYALAVSYFLKTLLPDIDEASAANASGMRAALYRWLLQRRQRGDDAQRKSGLIGFSVLILVVAVITNTFIAWDFGMMLFPHYHSTVFPMYFILGNMIAGSATVLILGGITSRTLGLAEFFKTFQLKSMGILLTGLALFWLYMFWAQFFVTWFGNLPNEMRPLWAQMYGHYLPYFWAMMFSVFGVTVGSMIFAVTKRHWTTMLLVSGSIVVGVWLNRYLMVITANYEQHTPFSSMAEVLLVGGLFAGFLTLFLLLTRNFPMISEWEQRDAVGEEGPAY